MSNALSYIGIARKAGAIAIGETNSGAQVRAGKGKLLMLASDASENARSRAENFVHGTQTPLVTLPYTKQQLSETTGINGCSMAVFTDIGLGSAFIAALADEDAAYAEIAQQLAKKNAKALLRKQEAAAHERNLRRGKAAGSDSAGKRRRKI